MKVVFLFEVSQHLDGTKQNVIFKKQFQFEHSNHGFIDNLHANYILETITCSILYETNNNQ